ncbi:MAG: hypothetical protein Q4G03_12160 [Planctomycetia bacterium]|nr:hypothetical protein [Planctomycetia bacterium]
MDNRTYSEFFKIDPSYYPVISADSIKKDQDGWKKTYPHQTFVKILRDVSHMLLRKSGSQTRPQWIEGAYGVGKSRIMWTISSLLTCKDAELDEYFNRYSKVFGAKDDLHAAFKLIRQKPIVTVSLSGLGKVDTTQKLIRAIFDAVQNALRNRENMAMNGDKTLRGRIVNWLSNPDNADYFKKKISQPRYRGYNVSEMDVSTICQHLSLPGKSTSLLDEIVTIGENEGVYVFTLTIDDLKSWLTEVIEINKLGAIVFFWDEFTQFFKDYRNSLVDLQQIAELAHDQPFYLFIATHMSAAMADAGDDEYKKIRDRFARNELKMPDNVAFELIADAIQIRDELKDDYAKFTDGLNKFLKNPRELICKAVDSKEEDVCNILPLHPLSALLLKYIAESFGSNQRSLFTFIKTDDNDDVHAFQWYAERHSPADGDLLTIDQLWDFFASLHDQADAQVAQIFDVYKRAEDLYDLSDQQSMVLKTVLIMHAISLRFSSRDDKYVKTAAVDYLVPNQDNIDLAFEGLDQNRIQQKDVRDALNFFVEKGLLFREGKDSAHGGFRYIAARSGNDGNELELAKREWRERPERFYNLFSLRSDGYVLANASIQSRFEFENAFTNDFTAKLNRLASIATSEERPWILYVLRCFARTEEDADKMRKLIRNALADPRYDKILFLDLTGRPFGDSNLRDVLDLAATEDYFRSKDRAQANGYSRQIDSLFKKWFEELKNTAVILRSHDFERHPYGSDSEVVKALHEYLVQRFPHAFDNAQLSENWFKETQLKKGVEFGVTQSDTGLFKNHHKLLGSALNTPEYWKVYPNESLSQLKIALDKIIDAELKANIRISIGDIVDYLMKKQGFTPRNLYAYLIGFLLKEYCQGNYQYSVGEEGDSGGVMTPVKLAELVDAYLKHLQTPNKVFKPAYLEIMTQEQNAYIEFLVDAFDLGSRRPDSVEGATSMARGVFSKLHFPLWPLTYNLSGAGEQMLKLLVEALRSTDGKSVSALANEFGKLALEHKRDASTLAKSVNNSEALCDALRDYLETFEAGQFFQTAQAIGAPDPVNDARNCVSSSGSYLWDQEVCDEEFHKLLVKYQIVEASCALNKFVKCNSFGECLKHWREYVKAHYMAPYEALRELQPQLAPFLECLFAIAKSDHVELQNDKQALFLHELREKAELINSLLLNFNDLFRQEYAAYVKDFDDRALEEVYGAIRNANKLQPFFCKDRSAAQRDVELAANGTRSKKARNSLMSLWKELTGTNSPREWSATYRTPILGMVPKTEREIARQHFQTMQSPDAKESQLKSACEYLASKPAFLNALDSQEKRDKVVVGCLAGKLAELFDDPEALRTVAEKVAEPYDWFDSAPAQNAVKNYIESDHRRSGNMKAVERVQKLSPEDAKDLLLGLVSNNADVAVAVLHSLGNAKE